eukprot:2693174-Prymnesium_polylepis.1
MQAIPPDTRTQTDRGRSEYCQGVPGPLKGRGRRGMLARRKAARWAAEAACWRVNVRVCVALRVPTLQIQLKSNFRNAT